MKINAMQARKLFFEDYIEFEILVTKIYKHVLPKSDQKNKNKLTLSDAIKSLSVDKSFCILEINAISLTNHKNCRNWLAHEHQNSIAKSDQIKSFQKIKKINIQLKKVLNKIKKRHPRSGRANE